MPESFDRRINELTKPPGGPLLLGWMKVVELFPPERHESLIRGLDKLLDQSTSNYTPSNILRIKDRYRAFFDAVPTSFRGQSTSSRFGLTRKGDAPFGGDYVNFDGLPDGIKWLQFEFHQFFDNAISLVTTAWPDKLNEQAVDEILNSDPPGGFPSISTLGSSWEAVELRKARVVDECNDGFALDVESFISSHLGPGLISDESQSKSRPSLPRIQLFTLQNVPRGADVRSEWIREHRNFLIALGQAGYPEAAFDAGRYLVVPGYSRIGRRRSAPTSLTVLGAWSQSSSGSLEDTTPDELRWETNMENEFAFSFSATVVGVREWALTLARGVALQRGHIGGVATPPNATASGSELLDYALEVGSVADQLNQYSFELKRLQQAIDRDGVFDIALENGVVAQPMRPGPAPNGDLLKLFAEDSKDIARRSLDESSLLRARGRELLAAAQARASTSVAASSFRLQSIGTSLTYFIAALAVISIAIVVIQILYPTWLSSPKEVEVKIIVVTPDASDDDPATAVGTE